MNWQQEEYLRQALKNTASLKRAIKNPPSSFNTFIAYRHAMWAARWAFKARPELREEL